MVIPSSTPSCCIHSPIAAPIAAPSLPPTSRIHPTIITQVDKWVILELSQVAKVDSIDISQNEPYTNLLATFEVLGRQTHPRTDHPKEHASALGAGEYGAALQGGGWEVLGRYVVGLGGGIRSRAGWWEIMGTR